MMQYLKSFLLLVAVSMILIRAEDSQKVRHLDSSVIVCPLKFSTTKWFINNVEIESQGYSSWARLAVLEGNTSALYYSVLKQDDNIRCGTNCSDTEDSDTCTTINFRILHKNGSREYCNHHGISNFMNTIGGINQLLCICDYGYHGKYCLQAHTSNWLYFLVWIIVILFIAALIFSLLRHENQLKYRPPNNKLRFVDVLNGALDR